MTFFIASQICAFIALLSDIASFQFKKREMVIAFIIISATLNAAHFGLLGKWLTCIMVSIGVMRFITSYFYTDKRLMYFFLVVFTITAYLLYTEPYDIAIYLAIVLINIGVFQKDDKLLRLFIMPGTSLVILYNFLIGSPMGMVLEGVFLGSNLVGYYRHYLYKK